MPRSARKTSRKGRKKIATFKKAPGAPKRFKSSYIHFFMHVHDSLKQSLPLKEASAPNISKKASEMWKNLPASERKYWEDKATSEKISYLQQKKVYKGPWKVKNGRAKKDPSAPKRNPSAFLLFASKRRYELQTENPHLKNIAISRMLGQEWRTMAPEVKSRFVQQEQAERAMYMEQTVQWKMSKDKNIEDEEESVVKFRSCIFPENGQNEGGERGAKVPHDDDNICNDDINAEVIRKMRPTPTEEEASHHFQEQSYAGSPFFFLSPNLCNEGQEMKMQCHEGTTMNRQPRPLWSHLNLRDQKPSYRRLGDTLETSCEMTIPKSPFDGPENTKESSHLPSSLSSVKVNSTSLLSQYHADLEKSIHNLEETFRLYKDRKYGEPSPFHGLVEPEPEPGTEQEGSDMKGPDLRHLDFLTSLRLSKETNILGKYEESPRYFDAGSSSVSKSFRRLSSGPHSFLNGGGCISSNSSSSSSLDIPNNERHSRRRGTQTKPPSFQTSFDFETMFRNLEEETFGRHCKM